MGRLAELVSQTVKDTMQTDEPNTEDDIYSTRHACQKPLV